MIHAPSSDLSSGFHNFLIVSLISLGSLSSLFAQKSITFNHSDISMKSALISLVEKNNLSIIFSDEIPDTLISASCNECSEIEAISAILSSSPSIIWKKNKSQFIIMKSPQSYRFAVSGRALDQETGEPVPFANIFIPSFNIGDISSRDGTFSIANVPARSCSLVISYIGYKTERIGLQFPKDEMIFQNIALKPNILISKEISITGSAREFMERSSNPGQVSFSPRHISTLPNLGEVDIFRSLQFLPGVQLGLGGTSDLYIRGGPPDQNLIILDGMPIYQTSHMFGFISGISADAIKDIQVYKGSIPVKYGGRVSSVIDLSSRSGNSNETHGSIYGNLMSQGMTMEFPFFNRGNWILSLRKSNPVTKYSKLYDSIQRFVTGDDKFNLLTQTAENYNDQNANYNIRSAYQDMVSRLSFLINPRHRLTYTHVSGIDSILENRDYWGFNSILGRDTIYIKEKTDLKNSGSILNWSSKWNHNYDSYLSVSKYVINSDYLSQQTVPIGINNSSNIGESAENNWFSDHSIKFNNTYKGFEYHTISSGIEETYFSIHFQKNNTDGTTTNSSLMKHKEFLHSFYLQDKWKPQSLWEIQSGLRVSYYKGNEQLYTEPRLAIKYSINPQLSLESSIDKHHQFVHRLFGDHSTRGTQSMWIISSQIIPCISSTNYHSGINWDANMYSVSLSGYFRSLKDLFQFQDTFSPHLNQNLGEANIDIGKGSTKGLEILLRKKSGNISGWISYNQNHTQYNFPGLNNGEIYLADHNRMHELKSVVVTRFWGIDVTTNWVYSSGGPYTSLDKMYVEPGSGYGITITGDQNNKKLDAVHHLDISVSRSMEVYSAIMDIGCSIYNVYNQNNISHKRYNPYTSELSVTNVSMFGVTPNVYIKVRF